MKSKTLFIFVVLSILASAAYSTLIDFETVPNGQNPQIHHQYIGNTYDSMGVDLWSKSSTRPAWNYNVYNNSGWFVIGGYAGYYPSTSHIGLNFDTPVSEVSMDLFSARSIQFWAYDADNQYISGVTSLNPDGGWKNKTITAPAGKLISRIDLEGTVNGAVVAMDNLSFIPEPATILILGFGSLALIKRRF